MNLLSSRLMVGTSGQSLIDCSIVKSHDFTCFPAFLIHKHLCKLSCFFIRWLHPWESKVFEENQWLVDPSPALAAVRTPPWSLLEPLYLRAVACGKEAATCNGQNSGFEVSQPQVGILSLLDTSSLILVSLILENRGFSEPRFSSLKGMLLILLS